MSEEFNPTPPDSINRRQRLAYDYLTLGIRDLATLSKKYNVSKKTIYFDIRQILKTLRKRNNNVAQYQYDLAVDGFARTLTMATNAFEQSQTAKITETTQYIPVKCKACKGVGCDLCTNGTIMKEKKTKSVTGSPGDPSFLKLRNDALKEIAKLQGLYPDKNINIRGTIQQTVTLEKLEKLPTEELLRLQEEIDNALIVDVTPKQITQEIIQEAIEP
jgi:hypothetical protein